MIEKVRKIAETFKRFNVEYLFIGKFGAVLYGYPGTTQDVDIFPKKDKANCGNLLMALKEMGFVMDKRLEKAILTGKDFIQIRGGPFPLDLVFAPDGIKSYDVAKGRGEFVEGLFPCASIDDIIESKRRSGRQRDKEELPRLELFREELKKRK